MFPLRHLLLLGAIAFAGTITSLAQMPMPMGHTAQNAEPQEIRELVSKYCRLDYEGARLDAAEWSKLQPLLWSKSASDFTQVDVISRYTVGNTPELERGKYTVTVHYRLAGRFDTTLGYLREPANSLEDVEFTVSGNNGEWRIDDISPNFPHPSLSAMVKWLTEKANSAADPSTKKIYEDAMHRLQTPATPSPQ